MSNKYHNKAEKKPGGEVPQWEVELCQYALEEAQRGKDHYSGMEDLYDDLYDMFRGERPEKNYDFESNIVLNKSFQIVWKSISYVVQKIYGADPVIGVKGVDKRGCIQREVLLDKWMCKDKYFLKLVEGCLKLFLFGTCFIKKTMRQEFREINGKMIPVHDYPEDIVLNNRDCITDPALKVGQPAQEGRFFIHRAIVDLDKLRSSKVKYINLVKVSDVLNGKGVSETETQRDADERLQKDQLNDPPECKFYQPLEVYERIGFMPVVRDKGKIRPAFDLNEKVEYIQTIITIANLQEPILIRFEENPYGRINIINPQLFFDPERWPAMGMIEPVKDMITAINDNINMVFDRKNMESMPPVIFDKHAQVDWDTIIYAPGQKWVAENPQESVVFPKLPQVPQDAWLTHEVLNTEVQTTSSITPTFQGIGKNRTATEGVLNSQYSAEKLDLVIQLIEHTWLRPSAEMSLEFAQKFCHPITFLTILGEPFKFDIMTEEYQFQPVASAVKVDQQKEVEIQQDIQLLGLLQGVQNPKTAQVLNYFIGHILRLRNEPKMAAAFDEAFDAEQAARNPVQEAVSGMLAGSPDSNQNGIKMSGAERATRDRMSPPQGLMR